MNEYSFFDRFGLKEQTGIGGRSRVVALSPHHSEQLPMAYSPSPPRHIHLSPLRYQPVFPATHQPQPLIGLSRDDEMLLKGVGGSSEGRVYGSPVGTFRTSAVLGPASTGLSVAKRRVVDFVSDDDFLSEVDRLRQSNSTTMGDSNIYGTPYHISAAREAQLHRRSSYDSYGASDGPPLQQGLPLPLSDNISGVPRVAQADHAPRVVQPPPQKYSNVDRDDHSSYRGRGEQQRRGRLEPLATQEAQEIEEQLQRLKRSGMAVTDRSLEPPAQSRMMYNQVKPLPKTSAVTSSSPFSFVPVPCSFHYEPLPPHHSTTSPTLQHEGITNLPGGMYGRAVPDVITDILYRYGKEAEAKVRMPAPIAPKSKPRRRRR